MTRLELLTKIRNATNALNDAIAALVAPDVQVLAPIPYFYPTNDPARVALWDSVARDAKVAIINPSSGAGTVTDPNYAALVDKLKSAGVIVYGYVATGYRARPLAETTAEIDRLYAQYPGKLDGIFLDEVASAGTSADITYYRACAERARLKAGAKVVLNPGTACPESYMNIADVVMNAETSAANYLTRTFAPWTRNYPASHFWHVVHGCTAAQMPAVVDRSRANNCGLLYVCESHDYNTLPPYWADLAARVAR